MRNVIITGGANGLGRETAILLASHDFRVHVIDVDNNSLLSLPENIFSTKVDITSEFEVESFFNNFEDLDILINNAGIWTEGSLKEISSEKMQKVLNINLQGTILTTKYALPLLEQSKQADLLFVNSTHGLHPHKETPLYSATKFGVRGFAESLALEYEHSNIRVSSIYPGGMKTHLHEKAGNQKDTSSWIDPHDVAQTILHILHAAHTMRYAKVEIQRRYE